MKVHSPEAALRGEPSYLWRAGQERRLQMMLLAGDVQQGHRVLIDGCGLGLYIQKLRKHCVNVYGLDIEFSRLLNSLVAPDTLACGSCERLPYADGSCDRVISHEVLEHVNNDAAAAREIVRVLAAPEKSRGKPGGRAIIFAPHRYYPFETHGMYWRNRYYFGNIPLLNYVPSRLRERLAPHVRAYLRRDLYDLFGGANVRILSHTVIYGGYDNVVARWGTAGYWLRSFLQSLEHTPLRWLGLSHFMVVEKVAPHKDLR